MARRISMAARAGLVAAIRGRYRASTRAGRTAILDEFEAITGYHRKHARRVIRLEALAVAPPDEADEVAPDSSQSWVRNELLRLAASDS